MLIFGRSPHAPVSIGARKMVKVSVQTEAGNTLHAELPTLTIYTVGLLGVACAMGGLWNPLLGLNESRSEQRLN
jgi:hypothetical protein